jgi:CHAT domain-containing protein
LSLGLIGCRSLSTPQGKFDRLQVLLQRGDLLQAQEAAEKASAYYTNRDLLWSWKFRVLAAQALSFRGMSREVLSTLNTEFPTELAKSDLATQTLLLQGWAYSNLHRFPEAEQTLAVARSICFAGNNPQLGDLLKVQGLLEIEKGNYERSTDLFLNTLTFAREHNDQFLQSLALLDLGKAALLRDHFDEAIEWSNAALNESRTIGARLITETALGNLGWAYYKTGDPDKALDLFIEAEKRARELSSTGDEVLWMTTAGYVYVDRGQYGTAEDSYLKALRLSEHLGSKEDTLNAQISLAFVSVLSGKLDLAREYSDQAIASARADGNRVDELYPLLTKGQVLARSGDTDGAEKTLSEVANDPKVDLSLKWEAQHELANLYADQHNPAKASSTYRAALATFETARSSLQHEDVKLPFLANASGLYDDYINLLIGQGKVSEALSVADHARARTLSEGLGQLKKSESVLPPPVDGERIARAAAGSVLYYWLGKQSYLWAITPQKTTLYPLPAAVQIDALVKRYRKSLERPQEGIEAQNADGVNLYRMLVQPAEQIIGKNPRVFVIPDGSLNGLNFETLVVPDPKPHYWIEDATITNASALRLLNRTRATSIPRQRKLLLVGNPVTATPEFVTPPQAAAEMAKVGEHFPATDQQVFSGTTATPVAYRSSKPEQFGYIHFVAHGTASRLSPLDSAIILSRTAPQDDSFRLYARDIIQKPLRADLVTISACYGAGTRAYSGEGLVGLSWAFLRAGAHNVIGALWDVSDASTPQLMDQMYLEIGKGKRPEEALRIAKLTLLHSNNAFRNPFYWAPFQLYSGW